MRIAMRVAVGMACVAIGAGRIALGEGELMGTPGVTRVGGGYEVGFKVAKPVDVTVRVVDGKGETVRHVASGLVGGERAAKPFAAGTLEQRIAWDGLDDQGKAVPAGCKVRVAAGMKAKFDKFIIWEKDACPRSRQNEYGVTSGGEVYVNQTTGTHPDTLRVFDSQGKYVRQAWPPTLNRPKESVERLMAGAWGATDWDGDSVPIKVTYNSWYLFGVRSKGMLKTTDGRLLGIFAGVGQGMFALDKDDFPAAMHWQPPWFIRTQMYKTTWRAVAGVDGDFYYMDSFHHVVGRFSADGMKPLESFTHNGKQKLEKPRYYLGEMDKAGEDGHFTGPNDIAVDAAGNLWVLDGERVKVYGKTGELVKEVGKGEFPARPEVPAAVKARETNPRALCFPSFLKMRPDGQLLIISESRGGPVVMQSDIDGREVKPFPTRGGTPYHGYSAFDSEGNWYAAMSVVKQPQQIWKFTADGKRAKFGEKDAIILKREEDRYALSKGIAVARNGDIHVVVQTDKWTTKAPGQTGGVAFGDLSARGDEACQTRVDVYGPDGALKKQGLVKSVGINDVALDREGNIYIIDGTMWHGAQMAAVATGQSVYGKKHWPPTHVSAELAKLDPKSEANKRYSLLSRLVKFGPEGGTLDDAQGRGQLWNFAGVSGVSPWNCDSECPAAQICVDPDERLWVADSFMYCIKAVDAAGNEMLRLGKYGNEDCKGGGGDKRHPELKNVVVDPEIPLSYPKGIALYRDYLFISDMFGHRVMRCRMEYAKVAEVAVP